MLRIRVLAFFLVALLPLGSLGDVAVWKGIGVQTADTGGVPPSAKANIYFIVDLTTFVGRFVVALPETKQVYDEGDRGFGINQHPTAPKETFYLTDAIETAPQQSAVEFNHQIAHLGGKLTKVFLGPNETKESALPRALKVLLSETAGGIFVTRGVVVQGVAFFQATRTQAANSVGKTVLQVSQDIRSELIANKGYAEIAAP